MNFTPEFYKHPETKGVVRGELYLQATILTRVDESNTLYLFYSKFDPKIAGVPQMVIRRRAKSSAYMPLHFKQQLDKKKKQR